MAHPFPTRLDRARDMVANPRADHTPVWRFAVWAALKRDRGQPISEAAEARLPPPHRPHPAPAPDTPLSDALAAACARTRAYVQTRQGGTP